MSQLGLGSQHGSHKAHSSASDLLREKNVYFLWIVLGTTAGYAAVLLGAIPLSQWLREVVPNNVLLTLGVLTSITLGSLLIAKTIHWFVALGAYVALVTIPFGILFGPLAEQIGVKNVVIGTAAAVCVTAVFGLVGFAIRWHIYRQVVGDIITGASLIVGVLLLATFEPSRNLATVRPLLLNIGIVLFVIEVILTFNRAKFLPPTLDDAVDASMQFFLDCLHLLFRLGKLPFRGKH